MNMGRYKRPKTTKKDPGSKKAQLQMKERDWRGLLAVLVVLSFVVVFMITIVITRDKELVGLVAATFSGLVSAVVTFYFTSKAKK